MKLAKIVLCVFAVFAGLLWLAVTHRTVSSTVESPTGKYTAIISYRTYLSYLPMPPGSSSDKPCFVKIVGKNGIDYGEIPVPMLQMAGIEWAESSASIKLIGEWNFDQKTCYYWSADGNRQIYVKNGGSAKKS